MSGWSASTRRVAAVTLSYVASQVIAAPISSQSSAPTESESGTPARVPVELFTAPRPKQIVGLDCDDESHSLPGGGHLGALRIRDSTCEALSSGMGGWVKLAFMVDPEGKPFEITVIDSTSNKMFEKVAIELIQRSTFSPGSLNGRPIESDYEMLYAFYGIDHGATPEFIDHYKAAMQAISAGDRPAADLAMKQLKVSNFHENAYIGLATYSYASKWGDVSQQLAGLQRAVVGQYLPATQFRGALLGCMQLELKAHEYAEALATWKRLEKSGIDDKTAAPLRAVVDQLERLRSDGTSYEVVGQMADGTWHLHLFKRHFRAAVTEGHISQVKLRCEKNYLYFAFDPNVNYEIGGKDGNCSIELVGEPSTKFTLTQF